VIVIQDQATIQEAVRSYDPQSSQVDVAAAEQERLELVRRFSRESWPTLPLNRYALGLANTRESFSWWIEFGTSHVGSMKGGSARKHIIYRQADGQWYFDRKRFKDEQQTWEDVRAGFVEAFRRADAGDWTSIDEIEALSWGPALRTKTLHCYFPTELLPICSCAHVRHFLGLLGSTEATAPGYDVVRLNRTLLEILRGIPECTGWNTKELERMLYHWSDPREQQKIVKIAPGEDARYWNDCLKGQYICVGWDAVGDLRQYESKDAFRTKFAEAQLAGYNNHLPTVTRKGNELWTLRDLDPGDLVVANKGISQILAVGTVIDPGYDWRDDRSEYKHTVTVDWDTSYAREITPQKRWATTTVAPISQALAAEIFSKGKSPKPIPRMPVDPILREIENALDRKGQAVLYGPPGTGKTYWARRFAVWWLLKDQPNLALEVLADPGALQKAEEALSTTQVTRRAWLIVANPSQWSWDRLFKDRRVDYRYGRLQRNYPHVRKGDLVIGYQSSPDKRITALATVSRELYTADDSDLKIELEPLCRVDNGLTFDELQQDDVLQNSEPIKFRCQGTLFALTEDEFDQIAALSIEREPSLRQHLRPGHAVGPLTILTFHPSYSYEDFIEGYRPVPSTNGQLSLRLEDGVFKRVCREARANPKRPYLVLIDEINRANVAKVFGELITLLEQDKRGVLVSLPQSKEAFTIPPNVFLLGTMNTADRSIKLLDVALRRRFAFLELMPDASLLSDCAIGNLDLEEFLEKLNQRIATTEGREKQIGHSFLLKDGEGVLEAEEFARRFRQEILPLLQEYCYEDYRILAKYIGDALVDKKSWRLNDETLADTELLLKALEEEFGNKEAGQ
jgi:5-methylcytosine-specific restriction protein B